MITKHSTSIFTSRFSLVYKSLAFLLIVSLLIMAIGVSALFPLMSPVTRGIREIGFFGHIADAFGSIFAGDMEAQNVAFSQLKTDTSAIAEVLTTHINLVIIGIVIVLILYFVYKLFSTLCHLPITDITNHFMTSNSRYGFMSNFIINIRTSFRYSLLHTLILLPVTALTLGIIALAIFLATKISIILIAPVTFLVTVVIFAIKRSMFTYWLPITIVENSGVAKALVKNFSMLKSSFGYVFGYYFIIYLLMSAMTILFTLATFGVGLLFAGGMTTVYFKVSDMVIYYRKNKLKYYLDADTIVNSKSAVSDGYSE